jgi:hypothetical protein
MAKMRTMWIYTFGVANVFVADDDRGIAVFSRSCNRGRCIRRCEMTNYVENDQEEELLRSVLTALTVAGEYGLQTEVVTYALLELSNNDKVKAREAILNGVAEKIK